MRQHRDALWGWVSREQQVHDGGVDRAPARGGQARGRELAHLLVGKAVVGGRLLGALHQQTRRDRRRQRFGERLRLARRVVDSQAHLVEVLQTEAPAQDGGLGERDLRLLGEPGAATRDQRPHRGRHHALRVLREPPHAVDLLDHPAVAVRGGHLLDDERDSLCLRVHDGGAGGVDRSTEHLRKQLAGLDLRESTNLHAAQQAHAIHVGEQVHGLGDERELFRADRAHQEHRALRVGADHVSEQPKTVVVRPLEIVDQQRERTNVGERPEGHGGEIERSEQPAVGRQARQARVVLPRHRVETPAEGVGRVGALRRRDRRRRPEDRPGEQEGAADLLVRRDGDGREALVGRPLAGGQQQARLPDSGLSLEREAHEPARAGRRDLLLDRRQLGGPPHDRPGRPANVQRHGRERLRERREGGALEVLWVSLTSSSDPFRTA